MAWSTDRVALPLRLIIDNAMRALDFHSVDVVSPWQVALPYERGEDFDRCDRRHLRGDVASGGNKPSRIPRVGAPERRAPRISSSRANRMREDISQSAIRREPT
jgi:hypothetical protein